MNGKGVQVKKVNKVQAEKQKEEESEHDTTIEEEGETDGLGDLAVEDVAINTIRATFIRLNNINKVNTSGSCGLPMMDVFFSSKPSDKKRFSVRALVDTSVSANVISEKVARK